MKLRKIHILFVLILTVILAACGGNKSGGEEESAEEKEERLSNLNTESEMPIVHEPVHFNIFSGKAATTADDWNDVLILNEYEKMTNVMIEWEQVPHEGLDEKRNLALGSGSNLPDAFYAAHLSPADLLEYGEQGIFIPLNDLIEEHAPNLKKLLDENPDIKKGLTFPNGQIYSFPTVTDPDYVSGMIGSKPWINEQWLEQLGMDNPETTDEFYEYLKAVKETDLNGNGKHDEIPLSSFQMERIIHWIGGSFGIGNKGLIRDNTLMELLDEDPETGELRFIPITDEYKEMVEYLRKLWSEDLIEKNIYTVDVDRFLANAGNDLYGSMVMFNPVDMFGAEMGERFIGGNVLIGPNGDQAYNGINAELSSIGGFAITKENENPEVLVRWLDYFFGEEGIKMFSMGIEGVTYEETEDGPKLMDHITNSADGLTITQELAKYLITPGGGHPRVSVQEYSTGSEASEGDLKVTEEILKPHLPETVWSKFTYTLDETRELRSLEEIEKYVTEMRAKFITGDIEMSEWDNYLKTVEDMGLDRYMEIQNEAFERYQES